MIFYKYPKQILYVAQKDSAPIYLGGTKGGEAAFCASPHARRIVLLSEAKNLLFSLSKYEYGILGN